MRTKNGDCETELWISEELFTNKSICLEVSNKDLIIESEGNLIDVVLKVAV